jgi:putative ABC transport system permease protein
VSAVWRVSRAAVRRRRLQTVVIGVVVALSTAMSVVALGLLAAASGPFDRAHARQNGAHVVAAFDAAKVSGDRLTQAAGRAGVSAVAGPYPQVAVPASTEDGGRPLNLTLVGRAGPGGAVDRVDLWKGRWATAPGEIVVEQNPVGPSPGAGPGIGPRPLGTRVTVPGGTTLTVVGLALSVSRSADAWVSPAQMQALHPTSYQLLLRFSKASTPGQVGAGLAAVTAGLPDGALVGSSSWLTLREINAAQAGTLVPFLVVFGILGLAVAVLIVANVVSGAVVAGFRHIGVLKALGFTPSQVMAVYLAMVAIPAIIGCGLGVVLGNLLAVPLLHNAFRGFGDGAEGSGVGVVGWVDVVAGVGLPLVVALSALLPARRARTLSATQALSAGSAPRAGRGRWVQRRLAGTRLPRSVSLGLGLPFARPARSGLTVAAVVLGVASVTFALGLGASISTYQKADSASGAYDLDVFAPPPGEVPPGVPVAALSPRQDEALLRSAPGVAHVTGSTGLSMRRTGTTQDVDITFFRGDASSLRYRVWKGRWARGAGEAVVSERFLRRNRLAVGDRMDLEANGRRGEVRIVGQVVNGAELVLSNWETLARFAPRAQVDRYLVQLRPGADTRAFMTTVGRGDPGLMVPGPEGPDQFIVILYSTISLLTLMLASVAALGVFNTVVLDARERRRDLGLLKSIGMTPRQVTVMMVTSMVGLGALSGLVGIPIGLLAHHQVVPIMLRAAQVAMPGFLLDVYHLPLLLLPALAGAAISALGAFLPARAAARLTIAQVLRNE